MWMFYHLRLCVKRPCFLETCQYLEELSAASNASVTDRRRGLRLLSVTSMNAACRPEVQLDGNRSGHGLRPFEWPPSKTVACQAIVANAYVVRNVQNWTGFLASLNCHACLLYWRWAISNFKFHWMLNITSIFHDTWSYYLFLADKNPLLLISSLQWKFLK
jgi:hypothetical protein